MLLEVENLEVLFVRDGVSLPVVRGVSFSIAPGDRVALVGESGCGKTMTCLALTRLPPTDRAHLSGRVLLAGASLLDQPADLARARGRRIAYVFQDPSSSLNPVMRVGAQVAECLDPARRNATEVAELLAQVRLEDPAGCARQYPCQLSGGMQQRVMLAMALASRPQLLVADEPTTALDVTTQAQVLALMDTLADRHAMAVLLVTHNLGLVAGHCRRVHVMYAGQIVESGEVAAVLTRPAHPYTRGLLDAVPTLDAARSEDSLRDIPGTVPAPNALPPGCAFAPRCGRRQAICDRAPALTTLAGGDGRHAARCWLPLWGGEGAP